MNNFHLTPDYLNWLKALKIKVRTAQIKAALAANSVLIDFYFDLGKMISAKDSVWGNKFLEQLSCDLKLEFPDQQGFSVTNLKYCRLFYSYIVIGPQPGDQPGTVISPQPGDEMNPVVDSPLYHSFRRLPWGHIKLLINKLKSSDEALFYAGHTLENSWSREFLAL
ncbi:MAG TPA: DUF1016 N-terminal domain-containing protein [Chitinispirillaceae bacterium]|nr:DUF1016 N-terminal domain-containing protein [Chitinispirillaceae bacterium]